MTEIILHSKALIISKYFIQIIYMNFLLGKKMKKDRGMTS